MLSRLEQAFERIVEGSIASVFRLRVQPAEIGRRLERAMLNGRVVSVGAILGPNDFEVRLHPDDAVPYADWSEALCREMEGWLAELAYARGILTLGPIRVWITEDATIRQRSVQVRARFDNETAPVQPRSPIETQPQPALRLKPESSGIPAIALIDGPITVGRANDNDLVISDPAVSRSHARLDRVGTGWRVVDLGSTNGTWINDIRVTDSSIKAGDMLSFGGVRFAIVSG